MGFCGGGGGGWGSGGVVVDDLRIEAERNMSCHAGLPVVVESEDWSE